MDAQGFSYPNQNFRPLNRVTAITRIVFVVAHLLLLLLLHVFNRPEIIREDEEEKQGEEDEQVE